MPLSKKHAEAIERLGREEFQLLSNKVAEAVGRNLPFRTRQQLVKLCASPTVHPKDLQMPFVRETSELGLAVLEALVGHKIQRGPYLPPRHLKPTKRRKVRQPKPANGSAVQAKGDMIIRLLVKENPKRPGGAAHDRFAKYRDGMTVSTAMEKGLRASDLRYDQKHNFIRLEA